jgi:hypothetical protein
MVKSDLTQVARLGTAEAGTITIRQAKIH